MSVETITLGCRLNFAESDTMARCAPRDADMVIVNSCAVTSEAVRQSRQAIRRARRQRPDVRIVVTGCAAQLEPDSFAAMPEVDLVLGNAAKLDPFVLSGGRERAVVEGRPAPTFEKRPSTSLRTNESGRIVPVIRPDFGSVSPVPAGGHARVRSFVGVQSGCDHRCTFCSIWAARGPSRSFPFEAIHAAVAREIDRGAKEITLTGVDITDYEGGLGRLGRRLLAAEPRLRRLRLSSLDSIEIDDELLELIGGEPRLMPHFHLSLQAGDDLILKRMKRRHRRADAVRIVGRIKTARPDATIGADLIAGFPTETEEMALNSLRLLDDCDVVAAHVFPFSPRPNTPAARMPPVERETVKARAVRLREAAEARRKAWLESLIGKKQRVLVESGGKGHSDCFAPVRVEGAERGELLDALIAGLEGDQLIGVAA